MSNSTSYVSVTDKNGDYEVKNKSQNKEQESNIDEEAKKNEEINVC